MARHTLTDVDLAQMVDLYENGRKPYWIANELRLSWEAVKQRFQLLRAEGWVTHIVIQPCQVCDRLVTSRRENPATICARCHNEYHAVWKLVNGVSKHRGNWRKKRVKANA